jgi:hypothetical protein
MEVMNQHSLAQLVGQPVDICGVARDAAAGAVVLLSDRTPVYIHGLDAWDAKYEGKPVKATGVLRHRHVAPEARVDADGAVSHGVSGASYVLEGASWTLDAP